jgi:hypothetical protein
VEHEALRDSEWIRTLIDAKLKILRTNPSTR